VGRVITASRLTVIGDHGSRHTSAVRHYSLAAPIAASEALLPAPHRAGEAAEPWL